MIDWIFVLSIWTYFFAEGATEGWMGASHERQTENVLISGEKSAVSRGVLDYHAWRLIEGLGIVGAIVVFPLVTDIGILAGAWLSGTYLIYEPTHSYIQSGDVWAKKKPWKILKWQIPRHFWLEKGIGVMGILVIVLSIISRN